jgi:hypothetical protein
MRFGTESLYFGTRSRLPLGGRSVHYICICSSCKGQYKVNKYHLTHNKSKCCRSCSRSYLWKEIDVINEIKKLIKNLNHFPSKIEIKNLSPQLLSQINKFGGFNKFREILDQKIIKRQKNYWEDFEKLKYHLNKNFKNLIANGIFPTHSMLKTVSLSMAVQRHGGSKQVAKKLNCKINKYLMTSDGHYVNSGNEYIVDEFLYANNIPHEIDGKISNLTNHRFDFKVYDYYIEVWGFEKSDKERCKKYHETKKIKKNIYKSLNLKLISIEKEIFQQPLDEINSYLVNLFSDIIASSKVNCPPPQKINIENVSKGCRFWNDENIISELKIIVKKLGSFPTQYKLKKIKRYDVYNAARRNGGLNKFKIILEGSDESTIS